jgi:hypothetical protein
MISCRSTTAEATGYQVVFLRSLGLAPLELLLADDDATRRKQERRRGGGPGGAYPGREGNGRWASSHHEMRARGSLSGFLSRPKRKKGGRIFGKICLFVGRGRSSFRKKGRYAESGALDMIVYLLSLAT